jgi:hypothetical protein
MVEEGAMQVEEGEAIVVVLVALAAHQEGGKEMHMVAEEVPTTGQAHEEHIRTTVVVNLSEAARMLSQDNLLPRCIQTRHMHPTCLAGPI